ncbi:MAG: energy-coupling factor transporter transmembrane protein EcfT [Thermoleophilia bacterium]|nr:energy-coupling factor transporter transmembrane protein EcfT [Thermoleophilia bacterium]
MLYRLNPAMKLIACVMIAAALTAVLDPVSPLVIFVLVLATGRFLGGLGLKSQVKPLWVFVLAGVAIVVANILFNKANASAPAVAKLGPIRITEPALWTAAALWLRLLCFALVSLVFVKTTEPQRLILSLVHQFRLNYRVAYGSLVGYRMLPLLQSDYQMIKAAQRLRGMGEFSALLHPLAWLRRYATPLLVGAVRRANRVALAMEARAFGAVPERTYRVKMSITRTDVLFVCLSAVVAAGVLLAVWAAGLARFTVG